MSTTVSTSGQIHTPTKRKTPFFTAKVLAFSAVLAVAVGFVLKYVFRYYLHYNEAAFTDPNLGEPNYWVDRAWLLMHMSGGMVALLTGPWQFWTGFRTRYARLHRWMGRIFLGAVAVGCVGAYHMAIHTTVGWGFGFSLLAMATAWFTTAAMAYYAILKRRIAIHKEWMVRAYVVTFAFVTFRIFNDYGPTSHLKPAGDLAITLAWACWVVPLFITELIFQVRRIREAAARA